MNKLKYKLKKYTSLKTNYFYFQIIKYKSFKMQDILNNSMFLSYYHTSYIFNIELLTLDITIINIIYELYKLCYLLL